MTGSAPEGGGPDAGGAAKTNERLIITHMTLENFKSYAGVQQIGPFHKVMAPPWAWVRGGGTTPGGSERRARHRGGATHTAPLGILCRCTGVRFVSFRRAARMAPQRVPNKSSRMAG
jgi:hypothetical protein